jgi:YidC/Oxa1 family membrane protein insertase
MRFADNGDLMGWRINGLDRGTTELVESGQRLLELQLLLDDQDISGQINWRRLTSGSGMLGEFVGTHSGLALEIRRSYQSGSSPGTVVQEVEMVTQPGALRGDYRVLLRMPQSLRKHTPHDGSLGDVFYGYSRSFAAPPNSARALEPVREKRQAAVAALAVRHVAVVVTPEFIGNDVMTVDPDTGVTLALDVARSPSFHRQVLRAVDLRGALLGDGIYRRFLYTDMWGPLRGLARLIERAIQALTAVVGNAGLAMIMFALLLRALMLPLGFWSIRQQRKFTTIQRQMKPKIEHINSTLKGAEKSEQVLQTYKEYGISPFSGLKGSIGLFAQLPILIALFAVTTESALFRDVPLLWVTDLSLPDRAFTLSFSIPGLGGYVNLLPILLGIVSVIAALMNARNSDSGSTRSGLILALVFVIFFYSCAAALVLYWIVVNVSQIFESSYAARTAPRPM